MSSISVKTLLAAPSKDFLSTRALDRWTSVAPPPMIGEGRANGRWRCGQEKQRRVDSSRTRRLLNGGARLLRGIRATWSGGLCRSCRASRSKRCSPSRAEIFFRCERSIDRCKDAMARPGKKARQRTGRKGKRSISRPTSVDRRRSRAAVADRATVVLRSERSPTPSGRSRPGFRNATSVKNEKATSIEDRLTWLILPGVYARLKG